MRKAFALAVVMAASLATSLGFSPSPVDEGYILSPGGIRLFYRIAGRGTDTVVVLHGGPGGHQGTMAPDIAKLLLHHRVLLYDQRGGGMSTLPADTGELAIEDHVRDLDAVRRYFGFEHMNLVGHEWGAALAAQYAIKHPELVESMLLISPLPVRAAEWDAYQAALTAKLGPAADRREALMQALRGEDPEPACRELQTLMAHTQFADAERASLLHGSTCSARPEALRYAAANTAPAAWRSLGRWDWSTALRGVTARTLVVVGEQDLLPTGIGQEWATALPNARMLVLPDAGHFVHVEAAERFWVAAEEFLAGGWPAGAQAPTRIATR